MTSSSGTDIDAGLAAMVICICVLGVILNLLVILVVALNRNMRASTDLFVVNLSISDILLAGLALPLKINTALYADGDFHGGDVGCKLIQFVPQFSIMCSISTMVAISFDRLFAITEQKYMRLRVTAVLIALIWVIALATSAPQLYEYSVSLEVEEYDNDTHVSCGSHDIPENFETVYACIVLVVSYVLPLMLIAGNYGRLVVFLYKRSVVTTGTRLGQGGNHVMRSKIKVLKLLICLTVIFIILWMPYFVLFTIEEITDTDNSSESASAAHTVKHLMIAVSTITNPILYATFNKTFRLGLRRLVPCCKQGLVGDVGEVGCGEAGRNFVGDKTVSTTAV
ncbi:neuropeptide FF receptor 2-like [Liolophura sinensis]|uniref:neuropeptide FF receptor 2-like n=1 Tax=Liolophura sinensis TaxID=3198878 RepID=UPI003159557F